MNVMSRILLFSGLWMIGVLLFGTIAYSEVGMDFCEKDMNGVCAIAKVQNQATAVVKKVVVEQRGKNCHRKVTKTHKRNLIAGSNNNTFRMKVSSECQYRVVFKTTSGCTGDKDVVLKPENIRKSFKRDNVTKEIKIGENGKTWQELFPRARLKGGCGTLVTHVIKEWIKK